MTTSTWEQMTDAEKVRRIRLGASRVLAVFGRAMMAAGLRIAERFEEMAACDETGAEAETAAPETSATSTEPDAAVVPNPGHGPCAVCGKGVFDVFPWWTRNPLRFDDARPVHSGECWQKYFGTDPTAENPSDDDNDQPPVHYASEADRSSLTNLRVLMKHHRCDIRLLPRFAEGESLCMDNGLFLFRVGPLCYAWGKGAARLVSRIPPGKCAYDIMHGETRATFHHDHLKYVIDLCLAYGERVHIE